MKLWIGCLAPNCLWRGTWVKQFFNSSRIHLAVSRQPCCVVNKFHFKLIFSLHSVFSEPINDLLHVQQCPVSQAPRPAREIPMKWKRNLTWIDIRQLLIARYDFAKATDQRRMELTKEKWSAIMHLKGPAEFFRKKINKYKAPKPSFYTSTEKKFGN